MKEITTVGADLAKEVIAVCAEDGLGKRHVSSQSSTGWTIRSQFTTGSEGATKPRMWQEPVARRWHWPAP